MDKACPARVSLLGVWLDRFTFNDFLNRLDEDLSAGRRGYVVTPNVDHIVRLKKDAEFRQVYANARFVVPDGVPLLWAAKWLGAPFPERIAGADLFPRLCRLAAVRGYSLYFLGASTAVCQQVKAQLENLYPGIKIAGYYSPPFGFEKSEAELKQIRRRLTKASPDIVFLGLGTPKQEKLIPRLLPHVPVKLFVGVGAALQFFTGEKNAPPMGAASRVGMGLSAAIRTQAPMEKISNR